MKAIILAGGGGTRLWPLSRESFPKQFLHFGDGVSLLQKTVGRLLKLPDLDEIVIATNETYLDLVKQQIAKIETDKKIHFFTEPSRKNTAPAIAIAVKYLQTFCQTTEKEPILVVPADHLIDPEHVFIQSVRSMVLLAKEGKLITFGVKPTKPETGYGYIQVAKDSLQVLRFVEKPNLEKAQQYIEDPNYYWNSGMFLFSAKTFWQELETHAPECFRCIDASFETSLVNFSLMPTISIDYAVMEKSSQILMCPLTISWSDIGSWDSLYDILEKDDSQNVKIGNVLEIDTKNSLIIGGKRLISTVGLDDMLIIETEDALFIGKKGQSQLVKNLVTQLLKQGLQQFS